MKAPARIRYRLYQLKKAITFHPRRRQYFESAADLKKNLDATSNQLNSLLLILLGYCLFCFMMLGRPDFMLIEKSETIKIPFASVEVSFFSFLSIGPMLLIAVSIYIHGLQLHLLELRQDRRYKDVAKLPFVFNLDFRYTRLITNLLFYKLVPAVLAMFLYKSMGVSGSAFVLLLCLTGMCVHFVLEITNNHSKSLLAILLPGVLFLSTLLFAAVFVLLHLSGYAIQLKRSADFRLHRAESFDLPGQDFMLADFTSARLQQVDLSGSNLSDTVMNGTRLLGGNDAGPLLNGVRLDGADLTGARLQGASLYGARLRRAHLHHTDFSDADMRGVSMRGANIRVTRFTRAKLRGANFSDARIESADFSGADLRDALFCGVSITSADFDGARLAGARFYGALIQNEARKKLERLERRGLITITDGLTYENNRVLYTRLCGNEHAQWKAGEYFRRRCDRVTLIGGYEIRYLRVDRFEEMNEHRDRRYRPDRLVLPFPFAFKSNPYGEPHCRTR